MAVIAKMYSRALMAAFNKEIDLLDDIIACTLHSVAYTPDQDVHDYVDDLTNELPTADGYIIGGKALVNDTLTYTAATNVLMYDADDVAWPVSTLSVRIAVLSDRTPATAATQPLLCYQQSDVDVNSISSEFRMQWSPSGIFSITMA
jgi:hypothetical protein